MKPAFHTLRSFHAVLLAAVVAAWCVAARADDAGPWPAKALRVVVPVAAGSSTDIVPRVVLEQLAVQLGQPVVVENHPGAGGTIGAAEVAHAAPDGYTLLAYGSAHTIAPALHTRLPYDPARDFAAVASLGTSPCVLVAAPSKGFRSVADLVAAGRSRPGGLSFSSVGIGSATHLSAERFRLSTGIAALHVPSKGGAEAMTEALAGRVDFLFGPVALVLPQVREGRLVALAVNGSRRAAALPEVPTLQESGIANAEYPIWYGLLVPAATPRGVVEKLHRETQQALRTPRVADRLQSLGVEPMPMAPAELDGYIRREIAINASLVQAAGLKPE